LRGLDILVKKIMKIRKYNSTKVAVEFGLIVCRSDKNGGTFRTLN
jgi:hypothetical protein